MPDTKKSYEKRKERVKKRDVAESLAGRDIAPLPVVANPARKDRCRTSLEFFCREYLGKIFYSPWSPDHRIAIEKLERAAREGGNFAWAMPRGGGKDALITAGTIWAVLYGYQEFVVVIAADEDLAGKMVQSIKVELETNESLHEDFPEVCHAVRRLGGIGQRANGQLFEGKRTYLEWKEKELTLPAIAGSACASARVVSTGITGGIRGMKFSRPIDGRTIRPGLVLINDAQTDESAKSPSQVDERESIVNGAIMGLAGPGQRIAAIMACTVIRPDDLSARFLDRMRNPTWQGERHQMLYGWAPAGKQMEVIEHYKKVRADSIRGGSGRTISDSFYIANREAIETGLRAGWESRKEPVDVSAIQHAIDIWCDKPRAFLAEYQNQPEDPREKGDALTPAQIAGKANGLARGIVPTGTTRLVAFVDVQKDLLFYLVLALQDDFTGHIVDYGTYPDQKADYFTKETVRRTLMLVEKIDKWEAALVKGLDTLDSLLLGRDWRREDGGTMRVERCLKDGNWGPASDLVKRQCRESAHAAIIIPSHGRFIGASTLPINERKTHPGDRVGREWRIPKPEPGKSRHVLFDANAYKTFVHSRFAQPIGGAGCFTIFGQPEQHQLFGEHIAGSEYAVETQGRGRKVQEWKMPPHRPDNDFLDCAAGACVAGGIEGASLTEFKAAARVVAKRVRLSDLQAAADKRWEGR